jgi:hypothetical protein
MNVKKFGFLPAIFILIFFINSCSDSVSSNSFYAGVWNVTYQGNPAPSSGILTVQADGSFLGSDPGTGITITGNVDNNGNVNNGVITYSGYQVGTINGSLSGNTGSGTWTITSYGSGTWTATR